MEAWKRLSARGPGWYWMVGGLRHGDLYHVCSLATAFADTHGRERPIYLVVGTQGQVQIGSMFREAFEEIIVAHGFPSHPAEWKDYFAAQALPYFGPDLPLLIHPQVSLDRERFSINFAQTNGLTWMQLYKQILHLRADVEPEAPRYRPHTVADAAALARSVGMAKGRSVLLFPYAQSLPVVANAHFAALAQNLAADGYSVFTSVAPGEAPIPGTEPLFVPFGLLPDLAEYAGWAVAVRSGISDILAPTRCRKTFIYPNLAELAPWSVNAMDYCRDAHEITFDFIGRSQRDFADVVRSSLDMGPLVARARQLSPFVGLGPLDANVRRVTLAEVQRGAAPWRSAGQAGAPGALILEDLPYREHPRMGDGVSAQLTELTAHAAPGARFFVCRDRGLTDYFEEVSAADLIAGRYTAARHWHTALAVSGVELAGLLPDYAREKVLATEITEVGGDVRLGDFFGDANHLALNIGHRPFSGAGFQFVEGWSGPERWGLWSDSSRSRLKLTFAAPPGPAARLELRYNTALSEALPEVSFTVSVNGHETLRSRMYQASEPLALTIPFGAVLDPDATSVNIVIAFDRLVSPHDQGTGPDRRLLGMGLITLAVHDVADALQAKDAADAA